MQILSNAEFARLKKKRRLRRPQIKAYYDAHLDDYDVVNIRRVFILAIPTAEGEALTREQAKAMAEAVKSADRRQERRDCDHQRNSAWPTDVVADPIRFPFSAEPCRPTMDKAAFALKEGEWTQLSDNPDEFVFIQLVNRSRKPLDEVSSQIEKQLQAEHLREELNALKSKTGVWMDEEYFASKNPANFTTPEASGQRSLRAERGEK